MSELLDCEEVPGTESKIFKTVGISPNTIYRYRAARAVVGDVLGGIWLKLLDSVEIVGTDIIPESNAHKELELGLRRAPVSGVEPTRQMVESLLADTFEDRLGFPIRMCLTFLPNNAAPVPWPNDLAG